MKPVAKTLFLAALAVLLNSPAAAQTLEEVCPGAEEGTGVLVGMLKDTDGDVMLPGASVLISWNAGAIERSARADVDTDGIYMMCHLPLETTVTVQPSFATMNGDPVQVAMNEVFVRQDLVMSLSGEGSGAFDDGDDRVWVCIQGGESDINRQFSRLVRCETAWQPLEQCPKKELGTIYVQPVGAGSGMVRELVEQFVQEAKRLGANAVVNVTDGRGGTSWIGTTHVPAMTGEAVQIDVDPMTCR